MYSAKEAAKITGLSTAALRYYEKESLLPPVKRNDQSIGNTQMKILNGFG